MAALSCTYNSNFIIIDIQVVWFLIGVVVSIAFLANPLHQLTLLIVGKLREIFGGLPLDREQVLELDSLALKPHLYHFWFWGLENFFIL